VIARPVGRALGAPATLLKGVTGQLARENAVRNPRRTAGTATALVIGIGVVAVFTVFGSSLRTSIDTEVSESFGDTDLVVRSTAFAGSGLPSSLVDGIGQVDGVSAVSALAFGDVVVDGDTQTATVTDPASLAQVSDLKVVAGALGDLGPRQVAVSESWAEDNGWTTGSTVELGFADGATVPATVGAIYQAKGALGDLLVPEVEWGPTPPAPSGPRSSSSGSPTAPTSPRRTLR
jgi:putative ABC transport system permease protein